MKKLTIILALAAAALAAPAWSQDGTQTVRVKDIVSYKGAGDDTIDGFGVVVGLKGTGDKDSKLAQELAKAYALSKANYKNLRDMKAEEFAGANVAYVRVSATVNETTTVEGTRLTATVAIADSSKSIDGGVLVLAELTFRDTKDIIASADGLLVSPRRAGAAGRAGEVTTATVEAVLKKSLDIKFWESRVDDRMVESRVMTLILDSADAKTANAIAKAINDSDRFLGDTARIAGELAVAKGIDRVEVTVPKDYWGRETEFRSVIESQSVNPDVAAFVKINLATKTIVITGAVRVLPCSVTVGGITINATPEGKTPDKPADGAEVQDPSVPVNQPAAPLVDLMAIMNAMNMTADEKAEVLMELDAAGCLLGKIIIK